jgi:hypothetical protein
MAAQSALDGWMKPMARNTTVNHRTGLVGALPSGEWSSVDEAEARADQLARVEALETQALYHAQCDDAASACWYIARSLGAARQLDAGEPSLDLLFELLGALADLPAEVCAAPLPEVVGADRLGITELCQQLAMAREQSQDVWVDAELAAPRHSATH